MLFLVHDLHPSHLIPAHRSFVFYRQMDGSLAAVAAAAAVAVVILAITHAMKVY